MIKRWQLLCLFLCFTAIIHAQILDITPVFPTANDNVTIIYDASEGNGALVGSTPVYAHAGLITTNSTTPTDWKFVQGNWGTPDPNVLMTDLGNNKHQIQYSIPSYYGLSAADIPTVLELAFVFRTADGTIVGRATDGSDIYYPIYPANAGLLTRFVRPNDDLVITTIGSTIDLRAASNDVNATMTITDNGTQLTQTTGDLLDYTLNVTTAGNHLVKLITTDGNTTVEDSFSYVVNPAVTVQDPPAGLDLGINYTSDTSVTLKFYAPNKNFIYVLGDFNNFQPDANYYMNRGTDGATWWLEITGLTPQQEYAFQYLVDGDLYVADPYSEKILDPWNDGFIPSITFPNLKPYPSGGQHIVSVLQTAKPAYNWQVTNFTKPAKEDLIIYELLVRDFIARHDYETMLDTLDYLSNLGINVIELMPVTEFEANESWGYNPSFHMALDKYYGTPEALKDFIDECHARGIAVVFDVVFNHVFGQSPLARLYWDAANNKPDPSNPWLNPDARHPFNVGYDVNHESQASKDWMDRCVTYLINEYKVDGFRFDLSKGFTQTNNPNNVGAWGAYDASRIALLKRLADVCWMADPNFYVMLEHFADNSEEQELSNYGMMLWNKVHDQYKQAAMGFSGSDFSNVYHGSRNFNDPHLISYMESHDEQRLMYENINFGNSSGSYNIQDPATALERIALANTFFFTIPGPKMFWQFGEVGYDIDINFGCRVCNKPILWNYFQETDRRRLYDIYKALIELKNTQPVFQEGTVDLSLSNANFKRIKLSHASMDAVVLGNFGVNSGNINPNFQSTGTWYEFFTGDSLTVTQVNTQINLQPGEYRLYTSAPLALPTITNTTPLEKTSFQLEVFPNPTEGQVYVKYELEQAAEVRIEIFNILGQRVDFISPSTQPSGTQILTWNGNHLPAGQYFITLNVNNELETKRVVIQR